ncbi:MAG TPA: hypothetical protein VNV87_06600 [Acidimicrobiales bacterium]|nr:hypothetical protein [Acidimicrobiales bacterium]
MLDGTPLDVAIRQVDEVSPPTWFALSYVHPDVGARAVNGSITSTPEIPKSGLTPGPGWGGMPAYRRSVAAGGPTGDISGRWAVC